MNPWLILFLAITFASPAVHPWGGRGHLVVCEAAIHLQEDQAYREALLSRLHHLGHACVVPDIQWRGIKGSRRIGNSTHFINPDVAGATIAETPTNYQRAVLKLSAESKRLEFGSNWWRAEQFYRRAQVLGLQFPRKTPPVGAQRYDQKNPFNSHASSWISELGLLGHFVADNGQPLHVVGDYDGVDAGLAGLHDRYENEQLNQIGPELLQKVVERARSLIKTEDTYLRQADKLEALKQLAKAGAQEFPKLVLLQRELAKKSSTIEEIHRLQIEQLARSAALLAIWWSELFVSAGRPALQLAGSAGFPFLIPYVAPDYLGLPAKR